MHQVAKWIQTLSIGMAILYSAGLQAQTCQSTTVLIPSPDDLLSLTPIQATRCDCSGGQVLCGHCTDISSDSENCGSCFNSCNGSVCYNSVCQQCGARLQGCCRQGPSCSSGLSCTNNVCQPPCGQPGAACCISGQQCFGGSTCSGGICEGCGGAGQSCCTSGPACGSLGNGLGCIDGVCKACGGENQPCCPNSASSSGSYCNAGTYTECLNNVCKPCGTILAHCCNSSTCRTDQNLKCSFTKRVDDLLGMCEVP